MAGRRDGETLSGSSEVCQGVLDPASPRSYVRPTALTATGLLWEGADEVSPVPARESFRGEVL